MTEKEKAVGQKFTMEKVPVYHIVDENEKKKAS